MIVNQEWLVRFKLGARVLPEVKPQEDLRVMRKIRSERKEQGGVATMMRPGQGCIKNIQVGAGGDEQCWRWCPVR